MNLNKLFQLFIILLFSCLFIKTQIENFSCGENISLNRMKYFTDTYQNVDCITERCQVKGKSFSLSCSDINEVYPGFNYTE